MSILDTLYGCAGTWGRRRSHVKRLLEVCFELRSVGFTVQKRTGVVEARVGQRCKLSLGSPPSTCHLCVFAPPPHAAANPLKTHRTHHSTQPSSASPILEKWPLPSSKSWRLSEYSTRIQVLSPRRKLISGYLNSKRVCVLPSLLSYGRNHEC